MTIDVIRMDRYCIDAHSGHSVKPLCDTISCGIADIRVVADTIARW